MSDYPVLISSNRTTPDENELLQGYRAASPEVREIMLVAARGSTRKPDSSRRSEAR
ncbi:MAG: hypothetical protein Q8P42_05715 [Gallionella sp.]|nr:hypothetical protein [Gallionella sp.]